MRKFLKQWLREQVSLFFWSYVPWLFVLIFGVFAVRYFPTYALRATGIFIIVTYAFVIWLIKPR